VSRFNKNVLNPLLYRNHSNSYLEELNYTMVKLDDMYNSKVTKMNSDGGSFNAVILSGLYSEDNTGASLDELDAQLINDYLYLFVFPTSRTRSIMGDPRQASNKEEAISIIKRYKHVYTARSRYKVSNTISLPFSQKVKCRFLQGSYDSGTERNLIFDLPTSKDLDPSFDSLKLLGFNVRPSEYFSNPSRMFMGNYTNQTQAPTEANQILIDVPKINSVGVEGFIKKIKNSPFFKGWSGPALAGVVANAQAESNFKQLAAGDDIKFYQKAYNEGRVSEKRMNNVKKRAVNNKCSWGYWQLNICPDNGAGTQLVNEAYIDIETEEGKKEWIEYMSKDEFQFRFVSRKIGSVIDIKTTDPYQAGYDITVKFERPADKEKKGVQRGNLAKKIYENYKDQLD
jgi:hypothetical protein